MSLPLPNRTNQDYVAEAVAAIPHWMAFLDEMEAAQDALIAEMREQRQGGPGAVPPSAGAIATPTPAAGTRTEGDPALPEGQPVPKVVAETPVQPPAAQRNSGADNTEASSPASSAAPAGPAATGKAEQAREPVWTGRLRERGDA